MLFQDGRDGAPDRQAGPVQRGRVDGTPVPLPDPDPGPACLEGTAVRAGGDFPERVLAGQPDFEVVRLPGGEPEVAYPQPDHPVVQVQPA